MLDVGFSRLAELPRVGKFAKFVGAAHLCHLVWQEIGADAPAKVVDLKNFALRVQTLRPLIGGAMLKQGESAR